MSLQIYLENVYDTNGKRSSLPLYARGTSSRINHPLPVQVPNPQMLKSLL